MYWPLRFRSSRPFLRVYRGTPRIAVAVKTLLTCPVSTCAAERGFSNMKRLKTPLRSAMSDARLSSLFVVHIHKHKEKNLNEVISVFAGWKDRYIPFAFMKAKVSIVILIYSASFFFFCSWRCRSTDMYTLIVYL